MGNCLFRSTELLEKLLKKDPEHKFVDVEYEDFQENDFFSQKLTETDYPQEFQRYFFSSLTESKIN